MPTVDLDDQHVERASMVHIQVLVVRTEVDIPHDPDSVPVVVASDVVVEASSVEPFHVAFLEVA